LSNFTTSDEKGDGFRGVWTGRQGGGAKDRLLVFGTVASVNRATVAGLRSTSATFIDPLQAASMFLQSHVRCCNWQRRHIGCHTEEDVKTRKSSEQS